VPPVKEAPSKPTLPTKSLPSTSIKSFLRSTDNPGQQLTPQPQEQSVGVVNDSGTARRESFTLPELHRFWTEFARPIEENNPRLFSMLTAHLPRLKSGHIIVFPLKNETQESELMKVKSDLLNHLRQSLKNDTLLLEVEYLVEESTETIIFTNSDRLKAMIEKNPSLEILKEKLRLDLD
jgi:hypothetical protein